MVSALLCLAYFLPFFLILFLVINVNKQHFYKNAIAPSKIIRSEVSENEK